MEKENLWELLQELYCQHQKGSKNGTENGPNYRLQSLPYDLFAIKLPSCAAVVVVYALIHAALLKGEVGRQAQDLPGGAMEELLMRRATRARRRPGGGRRPRDEVLDLQLPVPQPHLAQTKVRELDVAAVSEEDVVGLEVPVDRYPFSKACLQHSQTVIQSCMWFLHDGTG